ncbi:hypothetical protein BRADI_2g47843v3 [Brachypodium distachyon]|uniref:Uncharacterized protein n=1 Tax=Brachypodium distachyon TaxID=15368 RepID=A0A2K2DEG9_BRADI|nr:hypothetical protein BRADI_2g47843v3 [Brachypodium distachyon]
MLCVVTRQVWFRLLSDWCVVDCAGAIGGLVRERRLLRLLLSSVLGPFGNTETTWSSTRSRLPWRRSWMLSSKKEVLGDWPSFWGCCWRDEG